MEWEPKTDLTCSLKNEYKHEKIDVFKIKEKVF